MNTNKCISARSLYYFLIIATASIFLTSTATAQGKGSTLDNLMGEDRSSRSNTPSTILTKAAFLAEFERDYLETSDDAGHLPGMKQNLEKVTNNLAIMLPSEASISAACVQQRRRDGRIAGTSQARTIAAAMYDVIDELAPSANKGGMLRDRVNSLSQLGSGCPADFPAIKQYLSDYSDFAKGMVGRRKNLTAERKSKVNEMVVSASIDTPSSSVTKGNAVFTRIENGYRPKAEQKSEPTRPIASFDQFEELAKLLTTEYNVSADCVQEKERNGKNVESSQARAIANAMNSILIYGWNTKYSPATADASRLNKDLDPLSRKPPYGCPADFEKIKKFLNDFSSFTKSMIDRKEAEGLAKAQQREEAQRRKETQDKERSVALRTSKEKPVSFKDYMLLHDYGTGDQFYGSPLLKPDNKVYLFSTGGLDREEDGGLFVKSPGGGGYIHVKTTRSTPVFGDLRMNMPVVVIGRYVGNIQYTTVIGAVKTAPVIEAIAISKAPVLY